MSQNDRRVNLNSQLVPVQQSLTAEASDYRHYRMDRLMNGVVLEVYPADAEENRSAQAKRSRRGFLAEAKVLLVGTNSTENLVIDHVIISSPVPTGLDDYYEHLPRPSTNRVDGEDYSSAGHNVDPADLDGDWCVVGFIGGSLDQPVILSWWPHPRNFMDAGTSGNAEDRKSLDQAGRYFRRVNGVETVVTTAGDVYLSTNLASSRLTFANTNRPLEGRWPRDKNEEVGGSVLMQIKPTQTLEISWDEPVEGYGIRQGAEPQLPQTNPKKAGNSAAERENTFIRITSEEIRLNTSEDVNINSRKRITFASEDSATVSATNMLTLESSTIMLGEGAQKGQGVVRGQDLFTWLSNLTVLTATGPASINPADIATFITDTVSTKTIVE